MNDWWIINGRHEVLTATLREQGDDGRWYVEGEAGWFWKGTDLFDNEEDAKLRAIERVLGYAQDRGIPIRAQYIRTAATYAKEFRERVKELEREVGVVGAERDHAKEGWKEAVQWLCRLPEAGRESMPYWEKEEPWLFEESETP